MGSVPRAAATPGSATYRRPTVRGRRHRRKASAPIPADRDVRCSYQPVEGPESLLRCLTSVVVLCADPWLRRSLLLGGYELGNEMVKAIGLGRFRD